MPSSVTAGIDGNIAAMGAVSAAKAVSMIICGAPTRPMTPPSPWATAPATPCSGGGALWKGDSVTLTTSMTLFTPGLPVGAMMGCGAWAGRFAGRETFAMAPAVAKSLTADHLVEVARPPGPGRVDYPAAGPALAAQPLAGGPLGPHNARAPRPARADVASRAALGS